ncbi:MAG: FGGY-family carbohydrate kinase [Candidatus Methylomirabilales bacterium]
MPTLLTFDLGTTACKVCLWDAGGALLASADDGYPIHHPRPDWAEQDPADWWRAAVTAAGRCLAGQDAGRIAAIGLSSQREGVVPLGKEGEPLSRCVIWMDRRCRPQAARLAQEFGEGFLHRHTGLAPDPNYTACKLLWTGEHQPELLHAAQTFLQPRDYLYYRLTGERVTDYTLATRTMMLDIRRLAWWPEMLQRVGVRPDQFPPIHRSIDAPYRLAPPAARALGLPTGIPVALGGGDRACEAVGGGLAGERACDSTGTATQVSMVTDRLPDSFGRVPCGVHAIPGRYLFELGVTTTASAMRWLRELLGLGAEDVPRLEQEAAASPRGAHGLLFFPFLMGARSTRWNPDARGLLLGMSLGHTRGDIARALMEGVGFEVAACLDGLRDLGLAPGEVVLMGGGARSALWARIKAEILDLPLCRPRYTEAASLGAALLAARAVDLIDNPDAAAAEWNPVVEVIQPEPGAHRVYAERRRLFEDTYRALVPLYPRLTLS